MSVALEGNHICRAVKMALHISENAVLDCPSRSSGPLDFL